MAHAPDRPGQIGARVARSEDQRLLSGHASFIDDTVRPDMLHLSFVRADIAHARIIRVDTSALVDLGFSTKVFTGVDIEGLSIKAHQDYPEMRRSEQPLLARGRIRFVGEAVAAVLADDPYRAEDAAELVLVEHEPLPVIAGVEHARNSAPLTMFDGWSDNVFVERQMKGGDLAKARAEATRVITRTYRNQRQAGVSMECRGVVAEVDRASGVLNVWSSTQIPHLLRTYLSEELG